MKIIAGTQNRLSQVKMSPFKCCVVKSTTQISTQLSGTQTEWISLVFMQSFLSLNTRQYGKLWGLSRNLTHSHQVSSDNWNLTGDGWWTHTEV